MASAAGWAEVMGITKAEFNKKFPGKKLTKKQAQEVIDWHKANLSHCLGGEWEIKKIK